MFNGKSSILDNLPYLCQQTLIILRIYKNNLNLKGRLIKTGILKDQKKYRTQTNWDHLCFRLKGDNCHKQSLKTSGVFITNPSDWLALRSSKETWKQHQRTLLWESCQGKYKNFISSLKTLKYVTKIARTYLARKAKFQYFTSIFSKNENNFKTIG